MRQRSLLPLFFRRNKPAFNFTLRAVPSKGIENATLVVDGQRIPAGATSQPFTWNGATAHQASLAYNSAEALQFQGPWALFQLVATAQVTQGAGLLCSSSFRSRFQAANSGCPMVLRKSSALRFRVQVRWCWRPWDCMEGVAFPGHEMRGLRKNSPLGRKAVPQGLKPSVFSILTARLKSCPDTKHEFFRSP